MAELDINFEQIVPWNGASDTGRDVRLKWQRNFERVANALQTIFNEFGKSDDFLRRKQADTALEIITFAKGLISDAQILAKQGILSQGDITAAKRLLVYGEMIAYANLTAEGDIIAKKWIKAHEGIIIGKEGFAEGMSGFGGRIDKNANAELESLRLRRFLEVPELRFNRTEVTLGNEWRSPGAGIIERVEPDTDANGNQLMTGTAWLKLEDGEYGAISVGDICQGIFHSLNSSENATEDSDDSKGNFQFAGFYTCYFTVTDIVGADNKEFRYQMRPISDSWSIAIHPSEAMTFNCYGSFTNPDRMTSQYTTRTYTRLLVYQNTWEIKASNIAMQWGDLNNLAVHGINMSGYSAYLNNIYMTGAVKQINAAGKEIKVANDMGNYVAGVHYDFYDRVSYNGGLWLCVAENGTNTEPSKADAAWLNQVPAAQSVTSRPSWKSSETPYAASTILKMADTVVISNKKTAEPPYALLTDQSGNYLTDSNGDYIVHSPLVQSADWDVMLDASGLVDGEDGESVEARYSADGTNWHFPYIKGDKYMQQRIGNESPWSDIMPFIGKDGKPGEPGTDGKYPEYQWAVNDSATNHPTTGWQDTPPTTGDGQYLWMRTRTVDPNTLTATSWSTPVRIKGDVGESIKPIGAWHSGLNVPKLGVVTMGGSSFLAKKATSLPPLFCLTDENGNYLTSEDGGYLLTGEQNTEDYEFLVQSGKDGSDGKDYEWIFFLSDKETAPATPGSVQQDDYVPSGWTDDQTGVSETMPYEYTSFRTKKDGRWSDYSKPAIWAKWGKDGVSPIFADLDNEMDSIPLSAKGAVMERTIITTTASMWQGTTKLQLSNIAIDAPESIAATADKQTGVVTLTIANGIELAERNEVTIAVTAVVDGEEVSRTLTFTIAGVRAGADGKHAVVYKLLLSVNSVVKKSDGTYNVSGVSASRCKIENGVTSVCTEGKLKYLIDNKNPNSYETEIGNDVEIPSSSFSSKVRFTFYDNNGAILDRETVPMVSDGEGFVMLGNWRSGLSVPVRGVVMMNGCTYVAKKATMLPPLFCLTDENGNYLTSEDGGYLLTGEQNTSDYDLWAEKGAPGKDGVPGKDGAPGKTGAQGPTGYNGCVTRTWDAYIPTQKYRNDKDAAPTELEATGIRYLDVLLVESTTNASGYEAYECVKTCVGSNPIGQSYNEQGISADGCWRTASNLASAFIAKFIALDANIKFAANGQMVILDGNNKVVAGMTGSRKDGNKVRIWVGSENPNDAPVQINEDGSGHLAGGNVKWDKNGNVKVAGSLAMPIQILEHEYVKYLSFDTGFNFSLRYYGSGETVYLPSSADYSGVECRLFNGHFAITRSYMGTDIKVVNNGKFIINGDTYSSIQINVGMMAILQALSGFDENSQEISYWYVTNPESVEYYD